VGIELLQGANQAGLARTAGGSNNKEVSGVVHKGSNGWLKVGLFYVLYLFAHLFDQYLHVH
jgi:hypothetical protein